jgi:hypothetical protein
MAVRLADLVRRIEPCRATGARANPMAAARIDETRRPSVEHAASWRSPDRDPAP